MIPVKCDACGKNIDKGYPIYSLKGLTYRCCSAECLLYALHGKITINISKGYEEDED